MLTRCLRYMILPLLLLTFLQGHATLVTFRVDLTQQPSVSPNGVHIVGAFCNYDPSAISLSQLTPGRYEVTLYFAPGWTAVYKFVNGNTWNDTEGVFGECAFNTYRVLQVPASDTILPWVCFGHCDSACTPATGTRVACVGNSITYGWALTDPVSQSYPSILQDSLGSGMLVTNFGAPGAAVIRSAGNPYVFAEQFRHLVRFAPEEIFLLLGINDSKQPIWGPFSAEFSADYDSLWQAIDTLPSAHQVWICLPTTSFSPFFGIQDSIVANEIVPQIKAFARREALDQIDLRGFTAGLSAQFPDGTHPDSLGTAMIAAEIYRVRQLARPQVDVSGPLPSVATGFAWQWYLNGDTVPASWGGRAQSLSFAPSGNYKVGVQVDSLLAHVLISDSVNHVMVDRNERNAIHGTLFPNPAGDVLNWKIPDFAGKSVTLRIYSTAGKLEMQSHADAHHGVLDIAALDRGGHVFEAITEGEAWRKVFSK